MNSQSLDVGSGSQHGFVVEGITVGCTSMHDTVRRISGDCGGPTSFGVFTLNLDHVVKLRSSSAFRTAYSKARYVTADGWPIVWAGRLQGVTAQRVTGADLIEPLCLQAAKSGLPVYLFGSRFEALSGAARKLALRCPGLSIVGVCSPEASFDPESKMAAEHIKTIKESGAKLCFVALGAPKQELFSSQAMAQTDGVGFVCIGAGLDFIAGLEKRAPRWAQVSGVEWLWRLLSNPKRLGGRYWQCILALPSVLHASLGARRPMRTGA